MVRQILIVAVGLLVLMSAAQAADPAKAVRKGNEAYGKEAFNEALEQYQIAEAEQPAPELDYNIGNVLTLQGKYEEAVSRYETALNTTDLDVEQRAHYNLGNTKMVMNDFQGAIDSYKKALEIDPSDMDAKYNMEVARKLLKEQMEQQQQQDGEKKDQQQQQQQQQNQDQQQQDQEEQQKQEQQQQEQQQQQQEQQGQQGEEQDSTQQQQQQQEMKPKPMSKEDAERILNALKDDEQDIQKKIRRQVVAGGYSGNDW